MRNRRKTGAEKYRLKIQREKSIMIECADTKEVSLMEQGTGVEPFLVQIHPPLTFSDYFAPCICPKRCARFLVRKRKKPASVWL